VVRTLPKADELKSLKQRMADERKLDASVIALLKMAPKHALPWMCCVRSVSAFFLRSRLRPQQ